MLKIAIIAFVLSMVFVAAALADSPVQINHCEWQFENPNEDDYNIRAGVSFTNVSTMAATAVKFTFVYRDAFGNTVNTLGTGSGTITGVFSPGVLIQPRRALNGVMQINSERYPNSPVWELYNFSGKDVTDVSCSVNSVRFEDGSVWTQPLP